MIFSDYLENLYRFGLEFFRKFYGPYRAIVIDNKDPDVKGRIQVQCPRALLSAKNNIWICPMMDGAGAKMGVFWPPEIGHAVWIFFDNGDPTRPLGYVGGWYAKGELSSDLSPDATGSPKRRGFVTPNNNRIILDDTNQANKISIISNGGNSVVLDDSGAKQVSIDSPGSISAIATTTATIDGEIVKLGAEAFQPAILSTAFSAEVLEPVVVAAGVLIGVCAAVPGLASPPTPPNIVIALDALTIGITAFCTVLEVALSAFPATLSIKVNIE